TDEVLLSVQSLSLPGSGARPLLDDLSFDIHRGEILGIAGVEGNGQAELVEAIMGMRERATGSIRLIDADLSTASTRQRRESGIGYIPEDRHRHGLLLDSPLWENRVLGHQGRPPSVKHGIVDKRAARQDTLRIIDEYDVRTPGAGVLARALSGGNQQKLIVGREMSGDPILLIAAHPTRGVDVGAQAAIWNHIKTARREGLAVLLISADLDELIGLSDRIEVILRGRFVGSFDPSDVTPQQLGSAMTGAGASA
ncbi:MAG: ATP-binding cassette domain-containing protein, partial [Actinobacteria bacterium]|nr:ATP-binding cassette domain-containing protein [Actinomycetota bacterium]